MALTQVNSEGIKDGEIKDADVNASAAIAKSKLASLDIVNADVNASAAIALSKLASTPAVLTGSANNTITTVTSANNIQGEANLTFDGTTLNVAGDAHVSSTAFDPDDGAFNAANYPLVVQNPEDVNGDSTGIGLAVTTSANKVGAAIHHVREGGGSQGDMRFLTSGDGNSIAERLRIESNGIIRPKAASNRGGIAMMGAFMANPSAVYDQNSGTAVIAFDDEQFDENGWYNNSTYTYTPQVKGWYQMNFFIQWKTGFNGNAIEVQAYYEKNGATGPGPVEGYSTNYGNYAYVSWSPIIYFNGTSDYVKLVGNSSHNTKVSSVSEMSGYLVHPLA